MKTLCNSVNHHLFWYQCNLSYRNITQLCIFRCFQKKNSKNFYRNWGNLLWCFWTRTSIHWDMKFSHRFLCRCLQRLLNMKFRHIDYKNNTTTPPWSCSDFCLKKNSSALSYERDKAWPTWEDICYMPSFVFFSNKSGFQTWCSF